MGGKNITSLCREGEKGWWEGRISWFGGLSKGRTVGIE